MLNARAAVLCSAVLLVGCYATRTNRVPYTETVYEDIVEEGTREVEVYHEAAEPFRNRQIDTVAVFPFTDSPGQNGSGLIVADKLEIGLSHQPGLTVLERSRIEHILGEHALGGTAIVRTEDALALRKAYGVDVIINGSLSSYSRSSAVLNLRIVDSQTSALLFGQVYSCGYDCITESLKRDMYGWTEVKTERYKEVVGREEKEITKYRTEETKEFNLAASVIG